MSFPFLSKIICQRSLRLLQGAQILPAYFARRRVERIVIQPCRSVFSNGYLGLDRVASENNKMRLRLVNPDKFKARTLDSFQTQGLKNIFVEDLSSFLALCDTRQDLEHSLSMLEQLFNEDLRLVSSSAALFNLVESYFKQCHLLKCPEAASTAWASQVLQDSKFLLSSRGIPLLFFNLLFLCDENEEIIKIFNDHQSSLIDHKKCILIVLLALYKVGTREALRQALEILGHDRFPFLPSASSDSTYRKTSRGVLSVALLAYELAEYGLAYDLLKRYEGSRSLRQQSFIESSLRLVVLTDSGRLEEAVLFLRSAFLPRVADKIQADRKVLYSGVSNLLKATEDHPALNKEMLEIIAVLDQVANVESSSLRELILAPISSSIAQRPQRTSAKPKFERNQTVREPEL